MTSPGSGFANSARDFASKSGVKYVSVIQSSRTSLPFLTITRQCPLVSSGTRPTPIPAGFTKRPPAGTSSVPFFSKPAEVANDHSSFTGLSLAASKSNPNVFFAASAAPRKRTTGFPRTSFTCVCDSPTEKSDVPSNEFCSHGRLKSRAMSMVIVSFSLNFSR